MRIRIIKKHDENKTNKKLVSVNIFVCEEQWDQSSQYFAIQTEFGFPERLDQRKCHQLH